MRTYSKAAVVAIVALATLLVGASSALADSAKFDRRNTFVVPPGVQDNGSLSVHFRETGLGNTPNPVAYTLSADADAVYACQNNGGNFPSDPKKTAVSAHLETNAALNAENGNVEATLSIGPPPNTALVCPGGQHAVLVSVSYENVQICDTDHDVCFSFPGTFSRTFFTI